MLGGREIAARRLLAQRANHIRRDGRGDQTETRFRQTEARAIHRHDDIARRDQTHAARVRVAVHARDHRLVAAIDRRQHASRATSRRRGSRRPSSRPSSSSSSDRRPHRTPCRSRRAPPRARRRASFNAVNAEVSSAIIVSLNALRTSGRFSVTVAIWPSNRDSQRFVLHTLQLLRVARRHILNTPKRVSSIGAFMRRREAEAEHVAGLRGVDHAVVPQARARVIRVALVFVLLADRLLERLFLFGAPRSRPCLRCRRA